MAHRIAVAAFASAGLTLPAGGAPVAAAMRATGVLDAVVSDGNGGAIAVGAVHGAPCAALAKAGDATGWRVQNVPPASGGCAELEAVVADGRGGAWAVGRVAVGGGRPRALIERYDGRAWSRVAVAVPGRQSDLRGVAVGASGVVVAVGAYAPRGTDGAGALKTLIVERDGSGWRVVASPSPSTSASLNAVAAAPDGRLWAVGAYTDAAAAVRRPLVLFRTAGRWHAVSTLPVPRDLSAPTLTAVAASDDAVWAVGHGADAMNRRHPLTLRFDGRTWSVLAAPPDAAGALEGVAVAADGTPWAVGAADGGGCRMPVLMRFVGSGWEAVSVPAGTCAEANVTALHGVAVGDGGMLYAVGEENGTALIIVNRGSGWQIVRN